MAKSVTFAFHLLKTKLKVERLTNKQELKEATLKTWQSSSSEETQHLVMYMSSRLQAGIVCKGFEKYLILKKY